MVPLRREKKVRRVQISKDMLRDYGYTEGCDGCRHQSAGLEGHRGHNEECRARTSKEIIGSEEGRKKKEAQVEREAK